VFSFGSQPYTHGQGLTVSPEEVRHQRHRHFADGGLCGLLNGLLSGLFGDHGIKLGSRRMGDFRGQVQHEMLVLLAHCRRAGLLDEAFLKEAKAHNLTQLKGHRSVGGMRASIYNAMPMEGVRALVDFMREFERTHG